MPQGPDVVRSLRSKDRLDHHDENNVVVERLAVAAGHVGVNLAGLAWSVYAVTDGRVVHHIDDVLSLRDAVDRRDHQNHDAAVKGLLDLALVGVGDARARHDCRGIGARLRPHRPGLSPVYESELHLGPSSVAAAGSGLARDRAVTRKTVCELRTQSDLLAGQPLYLSWIPNRVACRRVVQRSRDPGSRVRDSNICLTSRGTHNKGRRCHCRRDSNKPHYARSFVQHCLAPPKTFGPVGTPSIPVTTKFRGQTE